MIIHNCRRYRLEQANKWVEIGTYNNVAYRNITGQPAADAPLARFLQFGSQMYDGESIYWLIGTREYRYGDGIYTTTIGWAKEAGNPFDGAGEWVIEKWLIRGDMVGEGNESARKWPVEDRKVSEKVDLHSKEEREQALIALNQQAEELGLTY